MITDRIKLGSTDFCFRSLSKEVSVSKSGHGVVAYRISAVRTSPGARYIIHKYGPEEGVPRKVYIPDIKTMNQNFHTKGFMGVIEGDSFYIKGMVIPVIKAHWKLPELDNSFRGFLIDTVKTFGNADEFSYSWGWSFKHMFDRNTPKGLATSYRSYYPMEEFVMQLGFGMEYKFKKTPQSVVLNPDGKREGAKKMQVMYEPSQFCSSGCVQEDVICKYYIADILSPQVGYTYRIEWSGNNR